MEENTYTISQVSRNIEIALNQAFVGAFWVVGEIQGLDRSRSGKHWYFQLCETLEEGDTVRLSATIWAGTRSRLFGSRGKLNSIIDPKAPMDGLKVRALCKINYYAPYGKISLIVEDIDPTYTLGDLEAKRLALIEKLTKEGSLKLNKECDLPPAPLKVGLITSLGSAAYNDFIKELERSGIGFEILACDARMQGEDTIPTVRAAFHTLNKKGCDLISIIRGGGSRLDLSWFDREELARLIIQSPVPVITGIGHEIDVTVCEMTAFAGLKTPTAAADFLVERVHDFLERVSDLGRKLARVVSEKMHLEELLLRDLSSQMVSKVKIGMLQESQKVQESGLRLAAMVKTRLATDQGLMDHAPNRLFSSASMMLSKNASRVASWAAKVVTGPHMRYLENRGADLSKTGLRVNQILTRLWEREGHFLELVKAKLTLLDPERILKRGYALVKNKKGELIKSVDQAAPKDQISILLGDGKIQAGVEKVEKEENHECKEKRQLKIW